MVVVQEMRKQAEATRLAGEGTMSKRAYIAAYFAVAFISTTLIFVVEGLPDLTSCKPVIPPLRTDEIDCCFVDTSRPIKDFKFNLDLPLRVRRPAHKLDDGFIRKYERAVELMKALPPEDPRSFSAQSKLHCSYCAGAYNEFNSSVMLSVHQGWFVLPFHRWYMYFHERILASLIGDDTFAIPYWAWDVQNDNPPANIIPPIFTNKNSNLYDELRSKIHQPPHRADLQFWDSIPRGIEKDNPSAILLRDNDYAMWATMKGHVQTPRAFYGGPKSYDWAHTTPGPGEFELGPHTAIHYWTGDLDSGYYEDMGPAFSSARDPIFYAHHSNIDRLWLMWKSWGGLDLDDPAWLDTEFLFYDENADMVRVTVRDSLNFENFRITYEQLEADWLSYTPKSIRDIDPKYVQSSSMLRRFLRQVVTWVKYDHIAMALGSFFQKENSEPNVFLGGTARATARATATARVSRPEVTVRSMEVSSVYDEVLVISGVVEKPCDATFLINMFLELPEADENTPRHCVEFLGAVVVVAEGLPDGTDRIISREFRRTVGIRETLRILDITRQPSVTVTFVPAWDPRYDTEISVRVTDLKMERRRAR
ncbi:unnamed protein product [Calypogeia fissa]